MSDKKESRDFFAQFRKIDELVSRWGENRPVVADLEDRGTEERGFSIRVTENEAFADYFSSNPDSAAKAWDPLVVLEQSDADFTVQLDVSGLPEGALVVKIERDRALAVSASSSPFFRKRVDFSHPVRADSLKWAVENQRLTAKVAKRPLDPNEKFVPL